MLTSRAGPQLIKGDSQLLFSGMGRLSENSVLVMKNKSFSITAEVEVPSKGAEGVIIHQGGAFAGMSLYAKAGKVKFAYNFLALHTFTSEASQPIPAGNHQVEWSLPTTAAAREGRQLSAFITMARRSAKAVLSTRFRWRFPDQTTNVGRDTGTPVSSDYKPKPAYLTERSWVQIDLGRADHDHLISPEQRLNLAMPRQ